MIAYCVQDLADLTWRQWFLEKGLSKLTVESGPLRNRKQITFTYLLNAEQYYAGMFKE